MYTMTIFCTGAVLVLCLLDAHESRPLIGVFFKPPHNGRNVNPWIIAPRSDSPRGFYNRSTVTRIRRILPVFRTAS